jgi:PhnB protein
MNTSFSPMLMLPKGTKDISFYTKAFGAVELRRWANDDGSIHVAELSIDGAMFHLHEEAGRKHTFSPASLKGSTTTIGLVVADVDSLVASALRAGASEVSAAQDYDYGYRQGEIVDPFGHHWMIQKVLSGQVES